MIIDRVRDKEEFKTFFNAHPMNDGILSYDFLVNSPFLFCCYDDITDDLKGYISIYTGDTDKLFLCGAGIRHNMPDNIRAIIKVCEAFNDDIYADTDIKEAKICLLKAGFKKIENNLYVRFKNGKKQK